MRDDIQILDCTLRDGGRLIDCKFEEETIKGIVTGLKKANINFIEVGFVGFKKNTNGTDNTTFFNKIDDVKKFINRNEDGKYKYLLFIQSEYYKNNIWNENREKVVDGIRLGFLKHNLKSAIEVMREIQDRGYLLFVQPVNILDYSKRELKELIDIMNEIKPYSFAIVDTFGAMYLEELVKQYQFIDKYLDKNIAVTLHCHNNMQMAFALAIILIKIRNDRKIIIDGTISGMGFGAGNLNTEFIANYLNENESGNYNLGELLKIVDDVSTLKKDIQCEPSIISVAGAFNWGGQNDLNYLKNNYEKKLSVLEQKIIVDLLPYSASTDTIDRYCENFLKEEENDFEAFEDLKKKFENRDIIIIARGPSVKKNESVLEKNIDDDAILIFVNDTNSRLFLKTKSNKYYFYTNEKSYELFLEDKQNKYEKIIRLSNVKPIKLIEKEYVLNYKTAVTIDGYGIKDSTIVLVNLLMRLGYKGKIKIAGFDGNIHDYLQIKIVKKLLYLLRSKYNESMKINFLTESVYKENL